MKTTKLLLIGTAATLLASTAMAQSALENSAAENRIEALNENISNDLAQSNEAFGNQGRKLGFDGSVALQANATAGNTDTATLGLGANLGYYDGTNGYQLQLSYQYSEANGTVDEDSLLYDLEYTRDFGAAYYGFAKLQGTVDTLPASTSDNFLGFGLGYKIYDTRDLQWTVQAGVGYRVADLSGPQDLKEGAVSLSSGLYTRFNDVMSFSMDTDVIGSDSGTRVYNDAGINIAMTETLAMRTSLVTEYNSNPTPGTKDTDNSIGVSLVYNFD